MYMVLNFKVRGDHAGKLVALEQNIDLPFEIKRVYYIWDTDELTVRGKHSHRKLEQVVVCVTGSCDFILDDGSVKKTIHIDNPAQGLYIKQNVWREFTNFSSDCVIMVLASEHYDERDYIKNYETFLKEVVV